MARIIRFGIMLSPPFSKPFSNVLLSLGKWLSMKKKSGTALLRLFQLSLNQSYLSKVKSISLQASQPVLSKCQSLLLNRPLGNTCVLSSRLWGKALTRPSSILHTTPRTIFTTIQEIQVNASSRISPLLLSLLHFSILLPFTTFHFLPLFCLN